MSFSPKTLWVAFPRVLGGYARICDLARRLGYDAIAPRAGEGLGNGGFASTLSGAEMKVLKDAGLSVYPWIFSRPSAVAAEVAAFGKLEDQGADALIIDAELPWDKDPKARDNAKRYGDLLRAEVKVPVYDAPWPAIDWHPGYPEAEFRAFVDGRLVQSYWTEIGWSARKALDVTSAQWSHRDPDRVLPIGVTYGRDELAKLGVAQLPPGKFSIAEAVAVAGEVTGGWYSAEAAAPGALEAIAATFAGTTEVPPTQPEAAALPIGWQDRAEQDAAQEECGTFYCRNRDAHDAYGAADTAPAPA